MPAITKPIFILIACLFFAAVASAQAQDSTVIKLEKYKQWYQSGIIDSTEYQSLRLKELHLDMPKTNPAQGPSLAELKTRYIAKITAAGILMPTGLGFIIGGIAYGSHPLNYSSHIPINQQISERRLYTGLLMGTGCIVEVTGALLLGFGLRDLELYKDKKASLRACIGGSGVGLVMVFK